jgi:hypothetical protein
MMLASKKIFGQRIVFCIKGTFKNYVQDQKFVSGGAATFCAKKRNIK